MHFYEQKDLTKKILEKRFENTEKYFGFQEVSGFTKFLDHILGLFNTKSKIYSVKEMIDALCDEENYFTGAYAGNILNNLISTIPLEKKDDKKEIKVAQKENK